MKPLRQSVRDSFRPFHFRDRLVVLALIAGAYTLLTVVVVIVAVIEKVAS